MGSVDTYAGPIPTATGGNTGELRIGSTGAQIVSDAHSRYQEAVLRGGVFRISAASAAPTAFVGGAGGTPLLSLYNPVGSGKNCVVMAIGIASRILGAAVLNTSFNLWTGVSVANTGTQTQATNALTNATGGSPTYCTVNTATTSSTALALALPVASYFWGTSVGQYITTGIIDVGGFIVAPPGVMVGFGASVAITTATFDCSMAWEEVPII